MVKKSNNIVLWIYRVLFLIAVVICINQTMQNRERTVATGSVLIDVQAFGAKGDGLTDDTDAIQKTIEYAKENGGSVYFPKGIYCLKKTLFKTDDSDIASALMMYSNQVLLGDNAVLRVAHPSVTHALFTFNEDDAAEYNGFENGRVEGITFDSDTSLTSPITYVNVSHSTNVIIKECVFKNGRNWHSIEINGSNHVKVENCVFYANDNREDVQLDACTGKGNLGLNDDTACTDIEISGCQFNVDNYPAIGNHKNAKHQSVWIHECFFSGNGGERGYISFAEGVKNIEVYSCTMKASDKGIEINGRTDSCMVHNNYFSDISVPYQGVTAFDNYIDDVFFSIVIRDSIPSIPDE